MIQSRQNLLVHLSRFVVVPILVHWIQEDDLINVDTALCSSSLRSTYLQLFHLYSRTFKNYFSHTHPQKCRLSFKFIRWIKDRFIENELLNHLEITKQSWITHKNMDIDDSLKVYFSTVPCITIDKCVLPMENFVINLLSLCTSLKEVNISNTNGKVVEVLFECIRIHCPNITTLNVSACPVISSKTLQAFCLQYASTLTSLNVSYCRAISDSVVQQLIVHCRQIKILNFRGCSNITKPALELYYAMRRNCITNYAYKYFNNVTLRQFLLLQGESLTRLDISNCSAVTDKSMLLVSSLCGGLTDLNISYCNLIRDEGVIAVVQGLPQLTSLNICWLSRVTTKFIDTLVNNSVVTLRSLHLWNNNLITESGFVALCNHASSLTALSLINLINFNVFDKLIPHLSLVTELNISENHKLSLDCQMLIGTHCTQLTDLNVSLSLVYQAALMHTCRSCTLLRRLSLFSSTIHRVTRGVSGEEFFDVALQLCDINVKYCELYRGKKAVIEIMKRCKKLKLLVATVDTLEDANYLTSLLEDEMTISNVDGDDEDAAEWRRQRKIELICNYKA